MMKRVAVTFGTRCEQQQRHLSYGLYGNHAYDVVSYNSAAGTLPSTIPGAATSPRSRSPGASFRRYATGSPGGQSDGNHADQPDANAAGRSPARCGMGRRSNFAKRDVATLAIVDTALTWA